MTLMKPPCKIGKPHAHQGTIRKRSTNRHMVPDNMQEPKGYNIQQTSKVSKQGSFKSTAYKYKYKALRSGTISKTQTVQETARHNQETSTWCQRVSSMCDLREPPRPRGLTWHCEGYNRCELVTR